MSDISNPTPFDASAQTVDDTQNRGYDNKLDEKDHSPVHVTLMNVDEIIVSYLEETIKPTITENDSTRIVPVMYGTPERWAMFRQHGALRQQNSDKALTPMIMIRRSSLERAPLTNPSNKYLETTWETGWNRKNAYDRFSALNGIKPSRQFRTVIIPDYVTLTYDVVLWTEYEQQMSDLIGQIQVEGDEYWGVRNGYKFRVKIDSFENLTDMDAAQDRLVRTSFQMKVGAYLVPERMIKNFKVSPTEKKTYSSKKVIQIVEVDGTTDGKQGPAGRRFT